MAELVVLVAQRARRDAVQVTAWAAGTAALALLTTVGVRQSYGTAEDRAALLETAVANPVIMLFRGLPSGPGEGAFAAFLIVPFLVLLAALMSTFLAVRHTRGDEEAGRAELVAATRAGRVRPILATLVWGLLAAVAVAVLVTAALGATGLGWRGSATTGIAVGGAGIAFLGVGLVAAQLQRTQRGANALAVWTVVVCYLLAGIGNALGTPSADLQGITGGPLVWLSPFGWAESTRPFDADDLRPAALAIGVGLLLAAAAIGVQAVRDLGEGVLPERRGRASARSWLSGGTALAWRLSAGAIAGWAAGGVITGVLATSLAAVIGQVGERIPSVQELLQALAAQGSLEQGAIVVFFTMLGVLASCCGVQVVCRARQEEAHGTLEPLLAAPLGRVRWLAGYLAVGMAGVLLTVAGGVGGALAGLAVQGGDASLVGDVLVTGGGQVAAAAVFLVLTAVVLVIAPRLTIPLGWALVAVGMVLGLFGPLFGLPQWAVDASPVAVAPTVDTAGVDLRGLGWLAAAAILGGAAALVLVRRRELTT